MRGGFWSVRIGESDDTNALGLLYKLAVPMAIGITVEYLSKDIPLLRFAVWVPIGCAIYATNQFSKRREEQAVDRLRSMFEIEMLDKLPATSIESAAWVNKLMIGMWTTFFEPKMCFNMVPMIQQALAEKTSTLKLVERVKVETFTLGVNPPQLTETQVFSHTAGGLASMEMTLKFFAEDLRVVIGCYGVKGVGDIQVMATEANVVGRLRLLPIMSQRLMLFAFTEKPNITIKISGSQYPAVFDMLTTFINSTMSELFEKTMTDPCRKCIGLNFRDLGRKALSGTAEVKVCWAEDLVSVDSTGHSDSMVEVYLCSGLSKKKKVGETPVAKRSSTPRWNTTCEVKVADDAGLLYFKVKDTRRGIVQGEAFVNLAYLPDGDTAFWALGNNNEPLARRQAAGSTTPWKVKVPLQGIEHGDLCLTLSMTEWETREVTKQEVDVASAEPQTLAVTVVEGRDLEAMDDGKSSDPFVRFKYGRQSFQTKVVEKDLNPMWNETFELEAHHVPALQHIKFTCMDMDRLSNDVIGSFELDLSKVIVGVPYEAWHGMSGKGQVKIRVERTKGMPGWSSMRTASEKQGAGVASVELVVKEARKLIAADKGGKSDPYCMVRHGGVEDKTHKVMSTVAPKWNFSTTLPFSSWDEPITLKVFDWDKFSSDDFLGEGEVPLLGHKDGLPWEEWVPLKGVPSGEVLVSVTLVGVSKKGGQSLEGPNSPQPATERRMSAKVGGAPSGGALKGALMGTSRFFRDVGSSLIVAPIQKISNMGGAGGGDGGGGAEAGAAGARGGGGLATPSEGGAEGLSGAMERQRTEYERVVRKLKKEKDLLLGKIKELEVAMAGL